MTRILNKFREKKMNKKNQNLNITCLSENVTSVLKNENNISERAKI